MQARGTASGFARRGALAASAALALAAPWCASLPQAQSFPARQLRLVTPYLPGGAADALSRALAPKLGEALGQSVVVENRPGAGGILAAEMVAKSPKDAHTIFVGDTGQLAIIPAMNPGAPYDPVRDFDPVVRAALAPLFLAVGPGSSATNLAQFIAAARAKEVVYGSPGSGTAHHLAMESFKLAAQLKLVHIPYKGLAQSVPAVLSGQVAAIPTGLTAVLPHARAGKLRILAAITARRTPLAPDVPSIAESGYPDFEMDVVIGLLVPAGSPRSAIQRLYEESARALRDKDTLARMAALGLELTADDPAQFAESIRRDRERFARIVKAAGIKGD
ncbi:MAG: tripartite tricarboxylate transporter substrate binding protein [Burkholderiales bacterium]|nr:tripartite tricarboxylate transporter substrate binding protein [Burkholderiales bacterium]